MAVTSYVTACVNNGVVHILTSRKNKPPDKKIRKVESAVKAPEI